MRHLAGERHQQHEGRRAHRWGRENGYCVIDGQKVPIQKTRLRTKDKREQLLGSYELFQCSGPLQQGVWDRVMRGLSTRNYGAVVKEFSNAYGIEKSAVSENFIEASREKVRQLMERPLGELRLCAVLIDGTPFPTLPGSQETQRRRSLAEEHKADVRRKLQSAYAMADYADVKRALERLHHELMHLNPSAARSLEEGLAETLTVHQLRVPDQLRRTLSCTNVIESAFSIVETVCRNVKRWREGDQIERWVGLRLARCRAAISKGHWLSSDPVAVIRNGQRSFAKTGC